MARYLAHTAAAGGARYRPVATVEPLIDNAALDAPGHPRVLHTPGHTAGHCSLFFTDRGVLFTGDALVNFGYATGKRGLGLHRFNEDRAGAAASLERLAQVQAQTSCSATVSHGPMASPARSRSAPRPHARDQLLARLPETDSSSKRGSADRRTHSPEQSWHSLRCRSTALASRRPSEPSTYAPSDRPTCGGSAHAELSARPVMPVDTRAERSTIIEARPRSRTAAPRGRPVDDPVPRVEASPPLEHAGQAGAQARMSLSTASNWADEPRVLAASTVVEGADRDPEWNPLFVEFTALTAEQPEIRAQLADELTACRHAITKLLHRRLRDGRITSWLPNDQLDGAASALANGLALERLADPTLPAGRRASPADRSHHRRLQATDGDA